MARLIDLDFVRELSFYSTFLTRFWWLNVLELMESIFGPIPINLVDIGRSITN